MTRNAWVASERFEIVVVGEEGDRVPHYKVVEATQSFANCVPFLFRNGTIRGRAFECAREETQFFIFLIFDMFSALEIGYLGANRSPMSFRCASEEDHGFSGLR